MIRRRRLLAAAAGGLGLASMGAADDAAWGALASGAATIVLFRHAHAPGVGDPTGMRIGDCSSQRNLDAEGRAQARRLGEAFRQRGVRVGRVLSSRWCRASETAALAFPGQVNESPEFDSFFANAVNEPAQTARALSVLRQWKGPGVLVVFTHQVNIRALTEKNTTSAEGLVVREEGTGGAPLRVLGRLSF